MPKGVNAPMVIEMKPHSIVPLSQSRPISEEAPHRYTKKYEGDACDEIFLEAVAKISEGDDHLGDRRIDGSTGSNRKSTKESLLQFLTSAGFGPLMTGARQAAPQNFGTLRLYAAPGVRDAPNLVFCINELLFALGGTWRRGRDSNPRYPCEYAAFRVRCFQPLSHLSMSGSSEGAEPSDEAFLTQVRRDAPLGRGQARIGRALLLRCSGTNWAVGHLGR